MWFSGESSEKLIKLYSVVFKDKVLHTTRTFSQCDVNVFKDYHFLLCEVHLCNKLIVGVDVG